MGKYYIMRCARRRRFPASPSVLPKFGWAIAHPPLTPLEHEMSSSNYIFKPPYVTFNFEENARLNKVVLMDRLRADSCFVTVTMQESALSTDYGHPMKA